MREPKNPVYANGASLLGRLARGEISIDQFNEIEAKKAQAMQKDLG